MIEQDNEDEPRNRNPRTIAWNSTNTSGLPIDDGEEVEFDV